MSMWSNWNVLVRILGSFEASQIIGNAEPQHLHKNSRAERDDEMIVSMAEAEEGSPDIFPYAYQSYTVRT